MPSQKTSGQLSPQEILVGLGIGTVAVGVAGFEVAMQAGTRIEGQPVPASWNPFDLIIGLKAGTLVWPGWIGWLLAVLVAGGLVGGATLVRGWLAPVAGGKKRGGAGAHHLGAGQDISPVTQQAAQLKADRFGVESPGLPIGVTVVGNRQLVASWEDTQVDIWGPRTGKTTCRAIPEVLAAPGPVIATSNKRDLSDATAPIRAERGHVWLFDPNDVAGGVPDWWWNPLSYVTDETTAATMANNFAAAGRTAADRADAHFENNGKALNAALLLAAACSSQPITMVWNWLNRSSDPAPLEALEDTGFVLMADELRGIYTTPSDERGSIFSTARRQAHWLTNSAVLPWVCASGPNDARPQFSPASFATSTDTLFSLSREGQGSAGALVTSLTVAVTEAAEQAATLQASGRLAVPLVAVLDEAANVCRWPQLPDLYSHFGSRGIVLSTFLQSWSQGVEVWGEEGMRKLWSAANVRVFGGGVADVKFLEELSKLLGSHDVLVSSSSRSNHGTSQSSSWRRDRIMDVDDLGALPQGRALVLASGARPTMIRTQHWQETQK